MKSLWLGYITQKVTIALFPASFLCHLSLQILACYVFDPGKRNFAWILCLHPLEFSECLEMKGAQ